MLAPPIIGFIVGAGGYMSLAVLKDTYTGKMPGPASAGYFIAAITGATVLGLTFMSRKQGYLAEQKTARVRTMSGKPVSETLRKLKQDKNLSAKDARTRKEIKAESNDVESVRIEKRNTDSYFTDDQPEYPTGNWVVEGENIYLITTYRPIVGSNGAMDKLEPKRVVINARGEGLTEELAYEDYSNKAREMLSTRKESKAETMDLLTCGNCGNEDDAEVFNECVYCSKQMCNQCGDYIGDCTGCGVAYCYDDSGCEDCGEVCKVCECDCN